MLFPCSTNPVGNRNSMPFLAQELVPRRTSIQLHFLNHSPLHSTFLAAPLAGELEPNEPWWTSVFWGHFWTTKRLLQWVGPSWTRPLCHKWGRPAIVPHSCIAWPTKEWSGRIAPSPLMLLGYGHQVIPPRRGMPCKTGYIKRYSSLKWGMVISFYGNIHNVLTTANVVFVQTCGIKPNLRQFQWTWWSSVGITWEFRVPYFQTSPCLRNNLNLTMEGSAWSHQNVDVFIQLARPNVTTSMPKR